MRLNLGAGGYPLPGAVNLDAQDGWRFQDGLGDYADESVEGVSISHALMYLPLADWPATFREVARVLAPGGVLRITEDATDDPLSERFGGYHDAVTLTTAENVLAAMEAAGLEGRRVTATERADPALQQNLHGGEPKVFFCEAVKPGAPFLLKPKEKSRRRSAEPTLTCVIPSIGRQTLDRAIRSAQDADEILVMRNEDGDRGYKARNEAVAKAKTSHLIWLDDDDVYAPGAIGVFREAARQNPGQLVIARMQYHHGAILWNEPILQFGRFGTPCILTPNIPGKVGKWEPLLGGSTGGDYMHAANTVELLGLPAVFRPEIVALIRPQ